MEMVLLLQRKVPEITKLSFLGTFSVDAKKRCVGSVGYRFLLIFAVPAETIGFQKGS